MLLWIDWLRWNIGIIGFEVLFVWVEFFFKFIDLEFCGIFLIINFIGGWVIFWGGLLYWIGILLLYLIGIMLVYILIGILLLFLIDIFMDLVVVIFWLEKDRLLNELGLFCMFFDDIIFSVVFYLFNVMRYIWDIKFEKCC